MKLIEFTINIEKAIVSVRCWLNVQGVDHPISFVLPEADLYAAAAVRGADSWENADLISVAAAQLGLTIQVPA